MRGFTSQSIMDVGFYVICNIHPPPLSLSFLLCFLCLSLSLFFSFIGLNLIEIWIKCVYILDICLSLTMWKDSHQHYIIPLNSFLYLWMWDFYVTPSSINLTKFSSDFMRGYILLECALARVSGVKLLTKGASL